MSPIISARGGLSSRGYGQFNLTATPYVLAGNYDALSTVTVPSGGLSSITFAGIPTTGYTHLQIRSLVLSSSTGSQDMKCQFNGDTATNYSTHYLYGSGSTAFASASSSIAYLNLGTGSQAATYPAAAVADILDYANTNKYKTTKVLVGSDANGSGYIWLNSGSWRSSSAITSIVLTPFSGTISEYSSFALYGVKA
jgi:hypothetical protein